jgi:hypothetical protein
MRTVGQTHGHEHPCKLCVPLDAVHGTLDKVRNAWTPVAFETIDVCFHSTMIRSRYTLLRSGFRGWILNLFNDAFSATQVVEYRTVY